jgi:hypothetical protein
MRTADDTAALSVDQRRQIGRRLIDSLAALHAFDAGQSA